MGGEKLTTLLTLLTIANCMFIVFTLLGIFILLNGGI